MDILNAKKKEKNALQKRTVQNEMRRMEEDDIEVVDDDDGHGDDSNDPGVVPEKLYKLVIEKLKNEKLKHRNTSEKLNTLKRK